MEVVKFRKVQSSLGWKFLSKILKGWERRQLGSGWKNTSSRQSKCAEAPRQWPLGHTKNT